MRLLKSLHCDSRPVLRCSPKYGGERAVIIGMPELLVELEKRELEKAHAHVRYWFLGVNRKPVWHFNQLSTGIGSDISRLRQIDSK